MKNIMKQANKKTFSIKLFLIMIFCVLAGGSNQAAYPTDGLSIQDKKEHLENLIPSIAERYIGITLKFGNHSEESGVPDNSQLFCLIYETAAKQAGLRFTGYLPMNELLKNTVEVQRYEIKNGDLIVLDDSHVAMIYRIDHQDKFYMIYVSGKRQQIVSFNNQNVVFEVYWLENLKGYYRLTENMFIPQD